jgi:hypothetical protein
MPALVSEALPSPSRGGRFCFGHLLRTVPANRVEVEEMKRYLRIAQMGLAIAAGELDAHGTQKAKKLAKVLRMADAAIDEYMKSGEV